MHWAGTRQWQRQPRRENGRHVHYSSAAASCDVVFATVVCASQNRYRDMCVHEQRGSDLELPRFQTNPTARSPTRSLQASAFGDSCRSSSLSMVAAGRTWRLQPTLTPMQLTPCLVTLVAAVQMAVVVGAAAGATPYGDGRLREEVAALGGCSGWYTQNAESTMWLVAAA